MEFLLFCRHRLCCFWQKFGELWAHLLVQTLYLGLAMEYLSVTHARSLSSWCPIGEFHSAITQPTIALSCDRILLCGRPLQYIKDITRLIKDFFYKILFQRFWKIWKDFVSKILIDLVSKIFKRSCYKDFKRYLFQRFKKTLLQRF